MRESNKYDHHLLRKLRIYAEENPEKAGQAALLVHVRYTGDIETLRQCGLFVMGDAGGVAIGDINEANLEKLERLDNVVQISVQPPVHLTLNTSVPEIRADVVRTGSPPYTGAGTVIGIIDDGIDIFHKNFRNADGSTRIISIWDQTLVASGSQKLPDGFTFGVEFKGATDITNALANPDQPFAHKEGKIGHGSHVAGIAAGNGLQSDGCGSAGEFVGVAPEADLIIVKVVPDPTSPNQKVDVGLAAQYIFNTAASQSPAKPAVANISLSVGIGACDGTQPVEAFLDGLLNMTTGIAIVVAAGNSGSLGNATDKAPALYHSGFHSVKHIAATKHTTVTLLVPPDQKTAAFFEIWYSAGAGRLQFEITGPTQIKSAPVAVGAISVLVVGSSIVQVNSSISTLNNKGLIAVHINPMPGGASVPAGSWTVTLTEVGGADVDMDLWLDCDDVLQQTVVAFPDRVISHTINSPGTALNVITVGAYGSKDGVLADFSSRGPTYASDMRKKPDICAPGLETNPGAGIKAPKAYPDTGCCCDCCYDFYTDMMGTSQATPHVTGVVALMLQRNPNLTYDQLRATIQTFCRAPAGVSPLPNNDWGYGKVDAVLATSNIPPGSAYVGDPPVAVTGIDDSGNTPIPDSTTGIVPSATRQLPSYQLMEPSVPRPFPALTEAFPASSLRIAKALRDVALQGKDNPALQTLVFLVSMHFDEVRKLINTNRRVATRWHRMFGPELLRHMLWNKTSTQQEPLPVIPAILNNQNVGERMSGLFDVLFSYGSTRLRNDINHYGPLFLALPGASFSGLNSFLPSPETQHGAGGHA
jgi:subtilisin family serine protease